MTLGAVHWYSLNYNNYCRSPSRARIGSALNTGILCFLVHLVWGNIWWNHLSFLKIVLHSSLLPSPPVTFCYTCYLFFPLKSLTSHWYMWFQSDCWLANFCEVLQLVQHILFHLLLFTSSVAWWLQTTYPPNRNILGSRSRTLAQGMPYCSGVLICSPWP